MCREFHPFACGCEAQSQEFTQITVTPEVMCSTKQFNNCSVFLSFLKLICMVSCQKHSFTTCFFSFSIIYQRLTIFINFTYLTYFNNSISFYGYLTLMFYYCNMQYLSLLHVRFYLGYIPRRVWVVSQSLTLVELPTIFPQSSGFSLYSHQHPTFSPSSNIYQIQKQIWQNPDGRYADMLCNFFILLHTFEIFHN